MSNRLNTLVLSLSLAAVPLAHVNAMPLGGGSGYSPIHNSGSADIVVSTASELQSALSSGYTNIYINGTLHFDAVKNALVIPSGVTLFSNRGDNGAPGGMLSFALTSSTPNNQAFTTISVGSNVTFTGLRVQGPVSAINSSYLAYGIQQANGTNLTVTNSELFGWPGAAIAFKKSTGGQVKYNYIHHNRKSSRGYGVVVQNGNAQADIMYNVFDFNRHAIAGSGKPGEIYTASWNLVRPDGNGHAFDMHEDSNPSSNTGGEQVNINNNMFDYGSTCWGHQPSANIRAVPTSGPASFNGNWFKTPYQFTDCGGRVKNSVVGVSGAIPSSESEFTATGNVFNAAFSYNLSFPCSVTETTTSTTWTVNCESIGGTTGSGSGGGGGGGGEEEEEEE